MPAADPRGHRPALPDPAAHRDPHRDPDRPAQRLPHGAADRPAHDPPDRCPRTCRRPPGSRRCPSRPCRPRSRPPDLRPRCPASMACPRARERRAPRATSPWPRWPRRPSRRRPTCSPAPATSVGSTARCSARRSTPAQPLMTFFGGEAELLATGQAKLSAYSSGGANGSQVTWEPPTMKLDGGRRGVRRAQRRHGARPAVQQERGRRAHRVRRQADVGRVADRRARPRPPSPRST